jgi:hypothetical protein
MFVSLLQKGLLPQNVFEFLSCFSWFKKVFAVESFVVQKKTARYREYFIGRMFLSVFMAVLMDITT